MMVDEWGGVHNNLKLINFTCKFKEFSTKEPNYYFDKNNHQQVRKNSGE